MKCYYCKEEKEHLTPLDKKRPNAFVCRQCNSSRTRKYATSKKGKESLNKASAKAYLKYKEKWITRAKTRYAIKIGVIKKPTKCEVCEKKCTGHALQAHHEDYTKPMEVIFLCYSCHADADKRLTGKF